MDIKITKPVAIKCNDVKSNVMLLVKYYCNDWKGKERAKNFHAYHGYIFTSEALAECERRYQGVYGTKYNEAHKIIDDGTMYLVKYGPGYLKQSDICKHIYKWCSRAKTLEEFNATANEEDRLDQILVDGKDWKGAKEIVDNSNAYYRKRLDAKQGLV